jgi:dTDP-4-dehydrorhamnose 3,5-epimerase
VKRFYTVSNHHLGFIRAWHGHRQESKYVTVVQGAALIGAVAIDDWDSPSPDLAVARFVVSAAAPSVLYIPAGHANGFMSLTDDTKLLFFSTATLAQSGEDDVRFPSRTWDIWEVMER